jgi:hypothetical protein
MGHADEIELPHPTLTITSKENSVDIERIEKTSDSNEQVIRTKDRIRTTGCPTFLSLR